MFFLKICMGKKWESNMNFAQLLAFLGAQVLEADCKDEPISETQLEYLPE
jgi:hypothetical protein